MASGGVGWIKPYVLNCTLSTAGYGSGAPPVSRLLAYNTHKPTLSSAF